MANILDIQSRFINIIMKEVTAQSGNTFISKAYLNLALGEPKVSAIADLTNKTLVDSNTPNGNLSNILYGTDRILVNISLSSASVIDVDRVYFTNADDDILVVADIERETTNEILGDYEFSFEDLKQLT